MIARAMFALMLSERRAYPEGSPDWLYRTQAAMKYLNIIRGIPAKDW